MFVATYDVISLFLIQLKENQAGKYIKIESIGTYYIEIMQELNVDDSDINETKDIFLSIIKPSLKRDLLIKLCDINYSNFWLI